MSALLVIIEKALKAFVAALIGFMLLWVFVQVISRYVFSYTPSYGEELARYTFVWIMFLSLPIVAKAGGHMAIETITSRIKGQKLKTARIIADILTIIFLIIMVYQGAAMVMRASFQTSPALEISMSWVYCVIPVGCSIMLLNVIENLFTLLRTSADDVK